MAKADELIIPIKLVSEWIPVSEELPENGSLVLTTIQVPGREPHVRSGMYFNGLFSNDNGDVWKATDEEVKAWMPLPEPCKAESEDKAGEEE